MPVFEAEINGESYEIEAPDEQSAALAVQRQFGAGAGKASPSTPQAPSETSPSLPARIASGVKGVVGDAASGVMKGVTDLAMNTVLSPIRVAASIPQTASDIGTMLKDYTTIPGFLRDTAANTVNIMAPMAAYAMLGPAGPPLLHAGKQLTDAMLTGQGPSVKDAVTGVTESALGARLPDPTVAAAKAVTKGVVRRIPGSSVELNEMAAEAGRNVVEGNRPPAGVKEKLYAAVDSLGTHPLYMGGLRKEIDKLIKYERGLDNPDTAILSRLENHKASLSEGGWTFSKYQEEARDLGEVIGKMAKNGDKRLSAYRDLLSVMHGDAADGNVARVTPGTPAFGQTWDASGNLVPIRPGTQTKVKEAPPGAMGQQQHAMYKTAQRLARQEYATNELNGMVEKAISETGNQGYTQTTFMAVVRQLEDLRATAGKQPGQNKSADRFVGSFSPEAYQKMIDDFKNIAKDAPAVPTMEGKPVGSSQRVVAGSIGSAVGGGVGAYLSGLPGAVVGPVVGAAAAHGSVALMTRLMTSEVGRRIVRAAMKLDPSGGPKFSAVINNGLKQLLK